MSVAANPNGVDSRHDQNPRGAGLAGSARSEPPRMLYALLTIAGVAIIAVTQLLLSVAMSQGAYDIDALKDQKAALGRTSQAAAEDLERVRSPQYLVSHATGQGMIPSGSPVFLRLSDQAISGTPSPAQGAAAALGMFVPNALLGTSQGSGTAPVSGTPAPAAPPNPTPQVPLQGTLPTPATH